MITKIVIPMHLESFYELYKSGCLKLDKNNCVTFEKYNKEGYPEIDTTEFLVRFPFFEEEDQGIILECEIDKNSFESVNFNVSGTVRGNSLTLECFTVTPAPQLLKIEDVVKIYPLTENALRNLPGKIGEVFALEKPAFQNLFEQAATRWEDAKRVKSVYALFEMSGLNIPQNLSLLDNLLQQAKKYKSTPRKLDKQERFLIHALVYERREPFPKSDIGILFDLCKILADKEQLPNYRNTEFYKKLEALKFEFNRAGMVEVLQYFEREPHYQTVRNMASQADFNQKDYITAALFTKYKELLREKYYKPLEMVKEIRDISQIFPEETKIALYLIAGFFPYERFYKDLYEFKQLRILKESRVTPETSATLTEVPLDPQVAPERKVILPVESKTPSLEDAEKPLDQEDPGKGAEPLPLQEIHIEQPSAISGQSNGATESVHLSQPTIESADNKSPSNGKMPILSEVLPFEEMPAVAKAQENLKKGKGRKPKGSKKPEDQDRQFT